MEIILLSINVCAAKLAKWKKVERQMHIILEMNDRVASNGEGTEKSLSLNSRAKNSSVCQ